MFSVYCIVFTLFWLNFFLNFTSFKKTQIWIRYKFENLFETNLYSGESKVLQYFGYCQFVGTKALQAKKGTHGGW